MNTQLAKRRLWCEGLERRNMLSGIVNGAISDASSLDDGLIDGEVMTTTSTEAASSPSIRLSSNATLQIGALENQPQNGITEAEAAGKVVIRMAGSLQIDLPGTENDFSASWRLELTVQWSGNLNIGDGTDDGDVTNGDNGDVSNGDNDDVSNGDNGAPIVDNGNGNSNGNGNGKGDKENVGPRGRGATVGLHLGQNPRPDGAGTENPGRGRGVMAHKEWLASQRNDTPVNDEDNVGEEENLSDEVLGGGDGGVPISDDGQQTEDGAGVVGDTSTEDAAPLASLTAALSQELNFSSGDTQLSLRNEATIDLVFAEGDIGLLNDMELTMLASLNLRLNSGSLIGEGAGNLGDDSADESAASNALLPVA